MFHLVQLKPKTLRQRIDQDLYRLAEWIRPMRDGKVFIVVLVGYVISLIWGI